jgi:hypothetical protein
VKQELTASNSVDIMGDVEHFGCGCESLVDVKSGADKLQYKCRRHRLLSADIVEEMK